MSVHTWLEPTESTANAAVVNNVNNISIINININSSPFDYTWKYYSFHISDELEDSKRKHRNGVQKMCHSECVSYGGIEVEVHS